MVGCISGDGTALKPLIILPRKTIEEEVITFGYNTNHVLFAYQEHAFMTARLFEHWAESILFEEVGRRREATGYTGPCVLILDGLRAHHSDSFESACYERGIILHFLVPHTSDQVQMLDLVTFGLMKLWISRSTFNALSSKQSNQIIKMMGAWHQSTAPHLVISAFNAAGMIQYLRDGVIYYRIDRSKAKGVRKWEEGVSNLGVPAGKRIMIENY